MAKRFETNIDINREDKASDLFCKLYGYTKQKLDKNDIDFKIYKDGKFICFLEVKGRIRNTDNAYPLPVSIRKILKMQDKKVNGVMLWACEDGIIFSRLDKLKGSIKIGGRKPRDGSTNDIEFMAYFDKSDNLKEYKYI